MSENEAVIDLMVENEALRKRVQELEGQLSAWKVVAEKMKEAAGYWQDRSRAADKYIKLSPSDPDITEKQYEAWIAYREIVDKPITSEASDG